jgi:hypothetical protein
LSIAPLMAGGPGGALASTSPVCLRLLSQRLIEGKEILKILATSALGIPRSTASNTFTLRSFEYALMQHSFTEGQVSCNPLLEGAPAFLVRAMPRSYAPSGPGEALLPHNARNTSLPLRTALSVRAEAWLCSGKLATG